MEIFVVITTVVLILIGLGGLYYQRKQSRGGRPKHSQGHSTAIKVTGSSGIVMKNNKSYGYDQLAEITDSSDIDAIGNEAHR